MQKIWWLSSSSENDANSKFLVHTMPTIYVLLAVEIQAWSGLIIPNHTKLYSTTQWVQDIKWVSAAVLCLCGTYMASSDTRTLSQPSGGSLWNTYVLLGRGEDDGGSDIHEGGEEAGQSGPQTTISKHNTHTDQIKTDQPNMYKKNIK